MKTAAMAALLAAALTPAVGACAPRAPKPSALPAASAVQAQKPAAKDSSRTAAAARGGVTGAASWYQCCRKTANGERFNPDGMTAAHRRLPFGTRVLVTNLSNGRAVVVRINDRGPFHGNRIIDLSRGAAGVIGLRQSGTARVRMTVMAAADPVPAPAQPTAAGAVAASAASPSLPKGPFEVASGR